MEARHPGFWKEGMTGDYCSMLYRDESSDVYKKNHILNICKCHVS